MWTHLATEDIRIKGVDARTIEGNPERNAISVVLLAYWLQNIITTQQRDGTAQGFEVVPPAPGGAGVDKHVRIAMAQFVPVG